MANLITENQSKLNGPSSAGNDFKSKIQYAEKQLEKGVHDTGERMGQMASNIVDQSTEYVKSGRDFVKENPGKGIAAAAAAGVVVGSLLTLFLRRRNQDH